jgi:hypothetical protein
MNEIVMYSNNFVSIVKGVNFGWIFFGNLAHQKEMKYLKKSFSGE